MNAGNNERDPNTGEASRRAVIANLYISPTVSSSSIASGN